MNKYKYIIASIVLGLLLWNCKHSFEDKIERRITKKYESGNNSTTISIKDLTDFKWDSLYIFNFNNTFEDVNRSLGFKYPYYKEFSRIYVFLNNNKIIYHEEDPENIESLENKEVVFKDSDSAKFVCYSYSNANFKVKVCSFEKGVYYELTQIK